MVLFVVGNADCTMHCNEAHCGSHLYPLITGYCEDVNTATVITSSFFFCQINQEVALSFSFFFISLTAPGFFM